MEDKKYLKMLIDKGFFSNEQKKELESIIPELAESDDERIRKMLIVRVCTAEELNEELREWIIAYLEKQKEQKPITNDGQQECPYKDLALVKNFFGEYKRKCKLSNKACDSKECEQWNELQSVFRSINEAFEDGKKEVVDNPERYGLCRTVEKPFNVCKQCPYYKDCPDYNEKKQEWSEEDEKLFWGFTAYVPNEELERLGITRDDILKKLKSLCPQPKDECGRTMINGEPISSENKAVDIPCIEWSEEDKEIFNLTITHLLSYAYPNNPIYCKEAEKCVAWLKSLRPQKLDALKLENFDPVEVLHRIKKEWPMAWEKVVPKQEWSKEDERRLNNIIHYLPLFGKDAEWIKSLKNRVSSQKGSTNSPWKPSKEQMNAFRSYIKDFQEKAEAAVGGWDNFDVMIQLFEQLQKLM